MNSSVHINDLGQSVTIWLKGSSGNVIVQASTTNAFETGWTSPVNLSATDKICALNSMGNNTDGDTVVTWTQPVSPGLTNLFAVIRPISTGVWSAPHQFDNDGSIESYGKISVNAAGQIVVQWTAYTDATRTASAIYCAEGDVITGTWNAVQQVSL